MRTERSSQVEVMLPIKLKSISGILAIILVVCFATFAQSETAMERAVLTHLNAISTNAGKSNLIEKENAQLKQKLLRYARNASSLRYALKGLDGKMSIVTSKDGKFRIYSWDTNSGGTMKFHDGVYQYKTARGRVLAKPFRQTAEYSARGFYSQIFQLVAGRKTYYLATATNILSTSQMRQDIEVFAIEGDRLNDDVRLIRTSTAFRNSVGFDYDFFSVVDRPERPIKLFTFDEAKKQFRFPIVLEDRKFPNGGRVTNKFITYRFNGKYFVKI